MLKLKPTLVSVCLLVTVATPAFVAASWVSPESSEKNVAAAEIKVDINQADNGGDTPLAYLCQHFRGRVTFSKIEHLLQHHGCESETQSPSK